MRIALISTPRSGNTWLRYLLADIYELNQYAVHSPDDIEWARLPDHAIVQLHWRRDSDFLRRLTDLNFRFVTIARHPMDVLISILHFCIKEPDTRYWLLGKCGDESAIRGHSPLAPEFLSYALSQRAQALLSVTPDWWPQPQVVKVRYEDLVSRTADTLATTCGQLEAFKAGAKANLVDVIERLTFDKLRPTAQNDHFWHGRPGLWQQLVPADVATAIARAHAQTFAALGYSTERTALPTSQSAAALWEQLA